MTATLAKSAPGGLHLLPIASQAPSRSAPMANKPADCRDKARAYSRNIASAAAASQGQVKARRKLEYFQASRDPRTANDLKSLTLSIRRPDTGTGGERCITACGVTVIGGSVTDGRQIKKSMNFIITIQVHSHSLP